jgi:plasmid maintenance system antidote protein VapI
MEREAAEALIAEIMAKHGLSRQEIARRCLLLRAAIDALRDGRPLTVEQAEKLHAAIDAGLISAAVLPTQGSA